jgi:hypothetical protein
MINKINSFYSFFWNKVGYINAQNMPDLIGNYSNQIQISINFSRKV